MNNPQKWVWDWIAQAVAEGAADKLALGELLDGAQRYSRENPDMRLAMYEQGRVLAAEMQESWWVILFEYWKCETLLFYKFDPEAALQVAARLVIETRKPQYAALPQRIAANLNFIAAYAKIDPVGYEKQISEAMELGRDDWGIYDSYHTLYWQMRARFLFAIGDAEALQAAWEHYHVSWLYHANVGTVSRHYVIYALADLLPAMWQFDRHGAKLQTTEMAEQGLELAPLSRNERLVATFTMWRALGARYDGDEKEAARWYRRALERQAALSAPRNAVQFAAMAFHEVAGDREKMLAVCEEAIEVSASHKLRFETAVLRWRKCEILQQMGRDWSDEAERLRDVSAPLPSKAVWESRLTQLGEIL